MSTITPTELDKILDDHTNNPMIISVSPLKSFQDKHIPQSINIPYKQTKTFVREIEGRTFSKDQHIILYSDNLQSPLASQAAHALRSAGFTKVDEFEEGTEGWFNFKRSTVAA